MKIFLFYLVFTASWVTVIFNVSSCKKDVNSDQVNASSIQDNSVAEKHFDAIFREVDDAAVASGISGRGSKFTITFDTMNSTKIMTLDYGTSNVLCDDWIYRRGKIVVTWLGRYKDVGTEIQISTVDFYQNDIKIEGQKTVKNMGRNAQNQLYWNIAVTGKITDTDGKIFTWTSNRVRTWIAGESTKLIRLDDKYAISGGSQGKNKNGINFTTTITKDLLIEFNCQYLLTAGTVEIVDADQPNRKIIVDYGSGTCDRQGTYTVNGVTTNFIKR